MHCTFLCTNVMSAAAGPVRKKRNFKALQLDVAAKSPPSPSESEPVAARRVAPAPAGKKRPPPMTLKAPKIPNRATTPAEGGEIGTLTVDIPNEPAPPTASISASENRSNYHNTLSSTLASLDLNSERKYDLRNEDLRDMQELGQGNGGSVKKVEHVPTGTIMAKKVSARAEGASCTVLTRHLDLQIVLIDAKPSVRKQILRELQIMHDCNSEYIISFYGAFISDPNICICMEYMDKGSLDGIYKKIGAIDIDVVAKVALAVLEGLTYLYDVHRIIHRGKSYVSVPSYSCSPYSRHQAIKHPVQLTRANQDLRLRRLRRAHQLDRGYVRRDINLYECALLFLPQQRSRSGAHVPFSLSVSKAHSTRSSLMCGHWASHLSSSPWAASLSPTRMMIRISRTSRARSRPVIRCRPREHR